MIITPHEIESGRTVYTVDHGDGHVERNVEHLPPSFVSMSRRYAPRGTCSSEFMDVQKATRCFVWSYEDFDTMFASDVFQSLALTVTQQRDYALSILYRLDRMLDFTNRHVHMDRERVDRLLETYCNPWMKAYWEEYYDRGLGSFYDYEGATSYLETLTTSRKRHSFLDDLLHELSAPISCDIELTNPKAVKYRNACPRWAPVFYDAHAFSGEEISELEELRDTLAGQITTKRAKQETAPTDVAATPESAIGAMPWPAHQKDLVFIMDALKEAGYMTTTDAMIVQHFKYDSGAKDRAKTYRDLRKKLRDGECHPDRVRLERLIEILRNGLR